MVFEDKSGKRWRRIKLSGLLLVLTAGAGVVTLVAATLMYLPHWQELNAPILSNVGGDVAGALTNVVQPGPGKPAVGATPSATPGSSVITGKKATAVAFAVSPAPVSKPSSAPAKQPAVGAASPTPAPSPSTGPGKSDFGHSRH